MTLDNSIGRGYNNTRNPGRHIVETLVNLLDLSPGKTIADIGAGTGNYSNAIADLGYKIIAIEPLEIMQCLAVFHPNVKWVTATAEAIPLANNCVDGAIIMLAMHHFINIDLAIKEINRIVGTGKIVIFAFERHKIPDFWLTNYFPSLICDTLKTFPSAKTIADKLATITQKNVEIIPFLLPKDLSVLFDAAGWCKPEIYLDTDVQNNISSFTKISAKELEMGVKKLAADINDGSWYQKYGKILNLENYDAGYRIVVVSS